jgi:hypothetical protein
MDLQRVRELLRTEQIELELSLPHAVTEARKDGLTTEDLNEAVMNGEVVEDYGERILLLGFASDYRIPFHVVLECIPGDTVATVVTAYIPSHDRWETNWKTRKRIGKTRTKKKKR